MMNSAHFSNGYLHVGDVCEMKPGGYLAGIDLSLTMHQQDTCTTGPLSVHPT